MRGQLKELNIAMWNVLNDPRATRLERLEAGRIIAALHGILVTGIGESALSTKAAVQLRAAQAEIAERLFKRKQRRRGQNQRAYLRRQIRSLEQQKVNQTEEENAGTESASGTATAN